MKGTLTIAGREFRSYFYSPLAYVVICTTLLALGLLFFLYDGGFWQVDRASMQRMFEYAGLGLTMLIIPVITMRLLAEEKRSGTLEMLITLPVRDSEVVLGKFLGAMGLVLVLLAATTLYPIMMFSYPWQLGPLDWGTVLVGYLGLVLFSAAGIAFGLMVSSITDSQVVAFFITFFAMLVLFFLADISELALGPSGEFFRALSLRGNLLDFNRGLIDTRNVVYFLSLTAICLVVAFRSLESRKWS